jgi:hypothetical protein
MKLLRRFWRWIAARSRDAFYYSGNRHLDLGRVLAFSSATALVLAAMWNALWLHKEINLGPAGFGGGLAAVLTSAAAFLAAKAWERRGTASVTTTTITPPPGATTTTVTPAPPAEAGAP